MKPLVLNPECAPSSPWNRPGVRLVVSGLLLLHLAAVFIGPLAVPPSSPLAGSAWRKFRPYLQAAFLNHGYKFFAPDPGPSHLVRYELTLADGTQQEGVFPNLKEHWPRLLYHRHMMISERLDRDPNRPEPPWIAPYTRSFAQHLLHEHHARQVSMYYRTHALPFIDHVAMGMKLNDPSLYQERPLLTLDKEAP